MQHIPLIITSDFDGGNAHDISEIAPDHWQMRIHGDTIYGPWYHVQIEETAGWQREVQLDILDIPDLDAVTSQADRPVCQIDGGPWRFLPFGSAQIVHTGRTAMFEEPIVWFWERQQEVPENRFRAMPAADVRIRLTVPPNSRMRLATTYPFTVSNQLSMMQWLQHLPAPRSELCRVEVLGRSEEDRPIHMVTVTDPLVPFGEKQLLVMTARHHPAMESSGSWAAEGIIEYLTSGDPRAEALLKQLVVVVIPMVNIDGVLHGEPHYNVNGIDLWMDYQAKSARETQAVYATLERLKPDFFVDWHGWICHHEGVAPYDGSYLDIEHSEPWDAEVYEQMAEEWRRRIYGFGTRDLYRSLFPSCPIGAAYWDWHTLGTTTEINPGGYTIGQVKQRALDNFLGVTDVMLRQWSGYPGVGVPGLEIKRTGKASLFAWGRNFEERRASRVDLWRQRQALHIEIVQDSDQAMVVSVVAATECRASATLRLPLPRGGLGDVLLDGRPLEHSAVVCQGDVVFVPLSRWSGETTVEMRASQA
jgi:hypothetical protein